MFLPILLFAAAGALLGAGTGGGLLLWNKAKREAAAKEFVEATDLQEEAIRAQMRLEEVKKEARAQGVDPDEVIRGLEALATGQVDAAAVLQALRS